MLWLVLIGMTIVYAMHLNDLQDQDIMNFEDSHVIRRDFIGKRNEHFKARPNTRVRGKAQRVVKAVHKDKIVK